MCVQKEDNIKLIEGVFFSLIGGKTNLLETVSLAKSSEIKNS